MLILMKFVSATLVCDRNSIIWDRIEMSVVQIVQRHDIVELIEYYAT